MEDKIKQARNILEDYKGRKFSFGLGCLPDLAEFVLEYGSETFLIVSQNEWAAPLRKEISLILEKNKIDIVAQAGTSGENTPVEDVFALADQIRAVRPKSIVCVGGGSAIDCAKAANVLSVLSLDNRNLEEFYGVGKVSEAIAKNDGLRLYLSLIHI